MDYPFKKILCPIDFDENSINRNFSGCFSNIIKSFYFLYLGRSNNIFNFGIKHYFNI